MPKWQPFWQNLVVSTYNNVLAFFYKILSLSRKCCSINFAKISDVFGFDRRKVKKVEKTRENPKNLE